MTARNLSLNEIYSKVKQEYDLESLLQPYKEGGTKEHPIERSTGTVLDWLINKKKFPPDIAGAGLVASLMDVKQGKSFPGDGSYGSRGHELVHYVAMKCDEFNKTKLSAEMFKTIAGAKIEVMEDVIFERVRAMLPWWIRLVSIGSWRWLRKRRKRVSS
jgi:hypothetical protein